MLAAHPKHVFKIKDEKHATKLFEEGRLADEMVVVAPTLGSSIRKGDRDDLAPMKLVRVNPTSRAESQGCTSQSGCSGKGSTGPAKPIKGTKYLVWESKPLSERDLSIPKGANTNPTGSMGFKKGLYDQIDQRHYFYDDVFNDLSWKPDAPGSRNLEPLPNSSW